MSATIWGAVRWLDEPVTIEFAYSAVVLEIVFILECVAITCAIVEHILYRRREREIEALHGVIKELLDGRVIQELLDGRWTVVNW